MAYSGKYIPKNLKKYRGDPDKVTYRSHWEKLCFLWCDRNDDIKHWSSEETVVPYFWDIDKRYHRYYQRIARYLSTHCIYTTDNGIGCNCCYGN